jgi:hypothetical protein
LLRGGGDWSKRGDQGRSGERTAARKTGRGFDGFRNRTGFEGKKKNQIKSDLNKRKTLKSKQRITLKTKINGRIQRKPQATFKKMCTLKSN